MKVRIPSFALLGPLILIVVLGTCVSSYFYNIKGLIECDFQAPYKAEVTRTVGIIVPPVGIVVGYMDLGK